MWVQSAVGLNGLLHGFYAFSSTCLRPTTRTRSTNEGQCQCVGWEGRGRNSGRGDPRALPASGCCDRSFAPQSSFVSLCRRPLPLQRVIRGPLSCCYWCCVKSVSIFQSWLQVHLQLSHRALVVPCAQNSQVEHLKANITLTEHDHWWRTFTLSLSSIRDHTKDETSHDYRNVYFISDSKEGKLWCRKKERHVKDKLFVIFEQTVDSVCSQHNHLLSLRYQILKSEEHLGTLSFTF